MIARQQWKGWSRSLPLKLPQTPNATPTGIPRKIRYATSSGNCSRASASLAIPWREPASQGRMPAGRTNHNRKAAPSPQINPAPELVARCAKKRPRPSPNRAPSTVPLTRDEARTILPSAPPAPPTKRPSSASIQLKELAASFTCAPTFKPENTDFSSLQIDGLNDVAREEKFNRPIYKDANLS